MISRTLASEDDTVRLAADIAIAARPGDLIALSGKLGAGKTVLARSFIRTALGEPDMEVPSPTYTLCNLYEGPVPVAHFDLYRLSDAGEMDELGLDDHLQTGCAIIEWPERVFDHLPENAVLVSIEGDVEEAHIRHVTIDGGAEFMERIARSLAVRAFLKNAGLADAKRVAMSADASARRYEAVLDGQGTNWYLMDAPKLPDGPPIRDGKPYSQIAHLAEDMTAFVAIGKLLREHGLGAPEIPAFDLQHGFALIEDLGSELVIDRNRQPVRERYAASARFLAHMHGLSFASEVAVDSTTIYQIPSYDRDAMMIEVELLLDWFLPYNTGTVVNNAIRTEFRDIWMELFTLLDAQEKTLVLRDFHSPNILWRADRDGANRIGLIDFQDAVIGPAAYDLASLAQDARVDVSRDLEQETFEAYCLERAASGTGFNREAFESGYRIMAAQRVSKILGIFVRLKVRDGKEQYLQHLPRMREYLSRSLTHPALALYRKWCGDVIGL